ncbi:MAG: methionine--tRNA ligase [Acidobacteriota bacterium]
MPKTYLTTPIYYVNDLPHIGHIYSTLVVDTVARYRRLMGDDVYFLTGTDEHGQKIERAAEEQGVKPIELADRVVARYFELWDQLELTHSDFIRTSQPRHAQGVRAIIERLIEKGDLYVDRHEGWYCVKCEMFYTEKELDDEMRCPIHGTVCEWKQEDNIFFRLSAYQDRLLELYDRVEPFVRPASRLNEVRNFVAQGLKDLSVSRTTVDWGVPFPQHEGHTVYVWLDALVNYISALGFGGEETGLYEKFWRDPDAGKVHVVGKDILRFHAVYWPAFLMAADLPLPTSIWAHGWWLQDSKKMSKSTGNIVNPDHLLQDFGHDPLRFYLLREMAFGQDASFSDEAFIERYNSQLANDLGNSVSRLVTLSRRAFDGHLPPTPGTDLKESAEAAVADYRRHMDNWAFHEALQSLWKLLQEVSQYLVRHEPWKKLKNPDLKDEVSQVLWCGLEAVRIAASALLPILPNKAPAVLRSIGAPVPGSLEDSLAWGGLPSGAPLGAVEPLFPRIDKAKFFGANAEGGQDSKDKGQAKKGKRVDAAQDAPKDAAKNAPKGDAPKKAAKPDPDAAGPLPKIDIGQFFDVELRVAEIKEAEAVKKSNKLLKLTVDAGDDDGLRTVVAGIAKQYAPEDLVGRLIVVVANLKPAKLMGIESNGMVLAASADGKPILLSPEAPVPVGTRVR